MNKSSKTPFILYPFIVSDYIARPQQPTALISHLLDPALARQQLQHKQYSQANNTMRLLPLLLLTALPAATSGAFFKKKHRRQKAGTKHEDHDAVHVVVNKVG